MTSASSNHSTRVVTDVARCGAWGFGFVSTGAVFGSSTKAQSRVPLDHTTAVASRAHMRWPGPGANGAQASSVKVPSTTSVGRTQPQVPSNGNGSGWPIQVCGSR